MLKEPPVVHAVSLWDEEARCARYRYNGRDLLTVSISGTNDVKYRLISDGNIQSDPFIQQVYLLVDGEAEATVRFEMTDDAINMRPHRAEHEQAIVGQNGRPLIKGINGVYDRNEDLLISWFGRSWKWNSHMFTTDESGKLIAELTVKLSGKPWTVNFYPQYYRMHLGYRFHEPWKYRPNGHTPAGWCSWEAFRREVSEDNVKDAAAFCAEKFKPYGFDYIQVDDGFQCMPVPHDPKKTLAENWLETNERFPSGHEGICSAVKEQGLKPGIWMSASVFNEQFPKKHESMFLKDEQGKVLDGKWIHYVLDCRAETLAATVKPLYEGLRTAGYEYVKTDQIRHLLYDGLHEMVRRGLMTNDEARDRFRKYMESAREGLGRDIYYLASWGVLPEVVGMVDACRIATDANPTWPKVRMQIVESGRWFHTQRILFVNDPDHICARTRPEWAQTLLSLVSLSGGLFMLSDPIAAYDEQRVRMIQKCLPPLPTATAETGELDMHYSAFPWTKQHGFEYTGEEANTEVEINDDDAYEIAGESRTIRNNHPHSSLWAFHFANGIGQWCVALRIATVPLKASMLNIKDCALDTDTEYLVFDFWAQKFMGIASETLELQALKLGECQVLCFREVKSHPQFLASTRHVSMGAVSVKSQEWNENTLTVVLAGVPGTTETYWFDCTSRWQQTAIEADGAEIKLDHAPCGVLALDVTFDKPQVQIAITWKKRKTQHS